PPAVTAGKPTLSLSPASGNAGTAIIVTGRDFDTGRNVVVELIENQRATRLTAQPVDVRSDGTFTVSVIIPRSAAAGGAEMVACSVLATGAASELCGRHAFTVR